MDDFFENIYYYCKFLNFFSGIKKFIIHISEDESDKFMDSNL